MSSRSRHSHHSRSTDKSTTEYTYPSYTTFGTTQSYTNYSSQTNNSQTASATCSTTRIRVKVSRKRDENGNYLPHKHEHSNVQAKQKHRVVKHKDNYVAGTDVFPESTATHEEIYPVTQSELTNFPTITTETSTFTMQEREKHHHHHKGYDREHHKWAVKKRELELLKLNPKVDVPEDQTFTALGYDEPDGPMKRNAFHDETITTTMASEMSYIDTRDTTIDTTKTDTFLDPIPAKELFPDYIAVPRRREIKPGLADAAVQPDEEPYDPKKEEELRRYIYLSRDKIYPKRRRNVMYANPLPAPPGLEDHQAVERSAQFAPIQTDNGLREGQMYVMPPEMSQKSRSSRSASRRTDTTSGSGVNVHSGTNTGTHTGTYTSKTSTRSGSRSNTRTGTNTYSSLAPDSTQPEKKNGGFTSVEELITANSKSAEFVEVSMNNTTGQNFIEVTVSAEEEDEEEEIEEEEEEEEVYEYEDESKPSYQLD